MSVDLTCTSRPDKIIGELESILGAKAAKQDTVSFKDSHWYEYVMK